MDFVIVFPKIPGLPISMITASTFRTKWKQDSRCSMAFSTISEQYFYNFKYLFVCNYKNDSNISSYDNRLSVTTPATWNKKWHTLMTLN